MAHERNHFLVELEAHKHVVLKVARSWRREAASHEGLIQHIVITLASALPRLQAGAIGWRSISPRRRANDRLHDHDARGDGEGLCSGGVTHALMGCNPSCRRPSCPLSPTSPPLLHLRIQDLGSWRTGTGTAQMSTLPGGVT